jgi:hypothetical protein
MSSGAIPIGVAGIAGDSAAAYDQELADCRRVACANEGGAECGTLRGIGQDPIAVLALLGDEADSNGVVGQWEELVHNVLRSLGSLDR